MNKAASRIFVGALLLFLILIARSRLSSGGTSLEVLGGFLFATTGLVILGHYLFARVSWTKTNGIVSKLNFAQENLDFEFIVDGKTYSGTSGSDPNWHKAGQKIYVLYDANDPLKCTYHNSWNEFLFGWGFYVVGIIVMFIRTPG